MMSDDTFWKSLQVTSLFVIYKVPIQIVLSLALAVLLQRETIGAGVVRSAILTPKQLAWWAVQLEAEMKTRRKLFAS